MSDYADGAEAMRKAILKAFADTYNPSEQSLTREIENYRSAIAIVRGVAIEDRTWERYSGTREGSFPIEVPMGIDHINNPAYGGGSSEKAIPEGAVGPSTGSPPSVTHGDPLDVARSYVAAIKRLGGHHEPCVCPLCCAAVASLAASIKGASSVGDSSVARTTALEELEECRDAHMEAWALLKEVRATFTGNDADGAPGADGSYWLGHSLALKIHYFLTPPPQQDAPKF